MTASAPHRTATSKGKQVYLQELSEEHATDAYAGWLNDPEVNKYLETRSVTVDELKKYIREKRVSDNAVLFGIFSNKNGRHIGNLKLEPIDRKQKKATLGLLIGDKEYWGKGIGTEATELATQYAFNVLGMQEVNLGVIAENTPAIRVYEKCGFTRAEVRPGAVNHDGTLYDQLIMKKQRI